LAFDVFAENITQRAPSPQRITDSLRPTGCHGHIVLWFDDCSNIGNIGYIVECQWVGRQSRACGSNVKSYKSNIFPGFLYREIAKYAKMICFERGLVLFVYFAW